MEQNDTLDPSGIKNVQVGWHMRACSWDTHSLDANSLEYKALSNFLSKEVGRGESVQKDLAR